MLSLNAYHYNSYTATETLFSRSSYAEKYLQIIYIYVQRQNIKKKWFQFSISKLSVQASTEVNYMK